MLIVKPIEDKAIQKQLCEECRAVFDPEYLACSAYDDEKLVGICQFEFSGDRAIIHDIREKPGVDDFEGMFIMTRGTLNFIDLCGFHIAECTSAAGEIPLIKATGFNEIKSGHFEINLTEAFTSKCEHCK
jgi:hypothetical protein